MGNKKQLNMYEHRENANLEHDDRVLRRRHAGLHEQDEKKHRVLGHEAVLDPGEQQPCHTKKRDKKNNTRKKHKHRRVYF